MKKYLLGLFAVVLAVGFSAFTLKKAEAPKQTVRYAEFKLTTPVGEKVFANYNILVTPPAAAACPSTGIVCWFRLTDVNGDGLVNQADFTIIANQLDVNGDGRISDDHLTENATTYQEKL